MYGKINDGPTITVEIRQSTDRYTRPCLFVDFSYRINSSNPAKFTIEACVVLDRWFLDEELVAVKEVVRNVLSYGGAAVAIYEQLHKLEDEVRSMQE